MDKAPCWFIYDIRFGFFTALLMISSLIVWIIFVNKRLLDRKTKE